MPRIAELMSKETPLPQPAGKIIYFDRRIWTHVKPDGSSGSTVDKIAEVLGRDVSEEEIEVLQPYTFETEEIICLRLAEATKDMRVPIIFIPKRMKYETEDFHTIWGDTDVGPYLSLCQRYNVPLYQLGVGRLYPPNKANKIAKI